MNYIAITLYLKGKERKRRGEESVKKMKEKKKREEKRQPGPMISNDYTGHLHLNTDSAY